MGEDESLKGTLRFGSQIFLYILLKLAAQSMGSTDPFAVDWYE